MTRKTSSSGGQGDTVTDSGSLPTSDWVGRWHEWLDGVAPLCGEHELSRFDRSEQDVEDGPPQLFVRGAFASTNADDRRVIDLLLAVVLERVATSAGGRSDAEIRVVGPEAMRALTTAVPSGLLVAELCVGPTTPRLRAVSLALVRVVRGGRSQDVASSVEELARLLDFEKDAPGSAAVARAVVRRLEVLTTGPGVTVSVGGSISRPPDESGGETMRLLSAASLDLDDVLELRGGRLSVVRRDRRTTPWRNDDYVIVRVGRLATRRTEAARSPAELRRQHHLAEISLGAETDQQDGTFSSRAASARQLSRANEVLRQAVAGDADGAVATLLIALTQPGATGPLLDHVASGIGTVADYWAVLPVVRSAEDDPAVDPDARRVAALLRERLSQRLDQLLFGAGQYDSEPLIPVMTPIVLEIGDGLRAIVDSREDGGHFLYELIPQMQERIRHATGVKIPGVRARGNAEFRDNEFSIQIEEVPVARGSVGADVTYCIMAEDDVTGAFDADVSEIHPLTGEWGFWRIAPVDADDVAAEGETLSAPQYLAHRLERVIRAHAHRMLSRQEVDALLDQWRDDDAERIERVSSDQRWVDRLTVLLRDLVAERVPIADWRALFDAVADAGGLDVDVAILRDAVRLRLRDALPGLRSGPRFLHLPPDLELSQSAVPVCQVCGATNAAGANFCTTCGAFLAQGSASLPPPADDSPSPTIRFLTWLHDALQELGPVLSIVTANAFERVTVASLASAEPAVVLTFTTDELAPR